MASVGFSSPFPPPKQPVPVCSRDVLRPHGYVSIVIVAAMRFPDLVGVEWCGLLSLWGKDAADSPSRTASFAFRPKLCTLSCARLVRAIGVPGGPTVGVSNRRRELFKEEVELGRRHKINGLVDVVGRLVIPIRVPTAVDLLLG